MGTSVCRQVSRPSSLLAELPGAASSQRRTPQCFPDTSAASVNASVTPTAPSLPLKRETPDAHVGVGPRPPFQAVIEEWRLRHDFSAGKGSSQQQQLPATSNVILRPPCQRSSGLQPPGRRRPLLAPRRLASHRPPRACGAVRLAWRGTVARLHVARSIFGRSQC